MNWLVDLVITIHLTDIRFRGAVYMILDRVLSGMKNKIWYLFYMKMFPNELVPEQSLEKDNRKPKKNKTMRALTGT